MSFVELSAKLKSTHGNKTKWGNIIGTLLLVCFLVWLAYKKQSALKLN